MQAKHTPGPWRHLGSGTVDGVDNASVSRPNEGRPLEEQRANARLIAAAPDLLAACKWALEYLENLPRHAVDRDGLADLRASIDAAEGA